MCKWIRANWAIVLAISTTIVIICLGVWVYYVERLSVAGQVGNIFGGFAGALAFIWLVTGFYYQLKELTIQRTELSFQRRELELQRESLNAQVFEIKHMGELASLAHVRGVMELAETRLTNNESPYSSLNMVEVTWMMAFPSLIKTIRESTDAGEVLEAANKLIGLKNPVHAFMSEFKSAFLLYASAKTLNVKEHADPFRFILLNRDVLADVPYLSQYSPIAGQIARRFCIDERFISITQLAHMAVSKIILGARITEGKEYAIKYKEVEDWGLTPAICKQVPPKDSDMR